MPKLIDYPRTSYTGAWEVAEVVDDTGGKCALETCARKLNRKVSGSFKAIVGSAVKFGLLTSKREILTTTTLFRRIKHAYDKQEELLFHREAFLCPPLFSQLCRKFRSRELPVAMLDVLLIREFGVEEINAQGVAKAFIDGARMVGVLDENNMLADIDQLIAQQPPRREIANPIPSANIFRQSSGPTVATAPIEEVTPEPEETKTLADAGPVVLSNGLSLPASRPAPTATADAIASLFGLTSSSPDTAGTSSTSHLLSSVSSSVDNRQPPSPSTAARLPAESASPTQPAPATLLSSNQPTRSTPQSTANPLFQLQLTGPGINTTLEVLDADDLALVRALLDKIERQLRRN